MSIKYDIVATSRRIFERYVWSCTCLVHPDLKFHSGTRAWPHIFFGEGGSKFKCSYEHAEAISFQRSNNEVANCPHLTTTQILKMQKYQIKNFEHKIVSHIATPLNCFISRQRQLRQTLPAHVSACASTLLTIIFAFFILCVCMLYFMQNNYIIQHVSRGWWQSDDYLCVNIQLGL